MAGQGPLVALAANGICWDVHPSDTLAIPISAPSQLFIRSLADVRDLIGEFLSAAVPSYHSDGGGRRPGDGIMVLGPWAHRLHRSLHPLLTKLIEPTLVGGMVLSWAAACHRPSRVELRIDQGLQLEVLRVDGQIFALRPRVNWDPHWDPTGTPLGPHWDPTGTPG